MAKSKNFKVKSTKKAAPKVEINEGTYVDTAVSNTKSGGKGGNGNNQTLKHVFNQSFD